jgi:hypothetical protein
MKTNPSFFSLLKRNKNSFLKTFSSFAIFSLIIAIFLHFNVSTTLAAIETNNWVFNDPSNYTFDSNKIEVTGGEAVLKGTTYELHDDTETEFNNGTYSDTEWYSDRIQLVLHEITPNSNTIGLWHLNNLSGDVVDATSNGHDGTNYGAQRGVDGKYRNAFSFDGTDDYVEVPDHDDLDGMSNFTMEAWIYPTDTSGENIILNKESTYEMAVRNGILQAAIETTDPASWAWQGTQSISANTWTHVAVVYDGSNMKFYINGTFKEQFALTGDIIATNNNLRFARRSSASYFDGKIDEIAIWDTALSDADLSDHAKDGLYESSGEYESKIFDAGSSIYWKELNWSQALPDYNWWNSSWQKRKEVHIDNTGNTNDLSNYQVRIDVGYDSDMKSDFSDLRFVNDSGQELSYWIRNYTASSDATVFVKIPSIAASSTETIYMYYGNNSASSTSNASATLEFFDDFDTDTSSNYTNHTHETHGGSGSWTWDTANSRLHNGGNNNCMSLIYNNTFSSYNLYLETYNERASIDDDAVGLGWVDSSNNAHGVTADDSGHGTAGFTRINASGGPAALTTEDSNFDHNSSGPFRIAIARDENGHIYSWFNDTPNTQNGYDDSSFTPAKIALFSHAMNPSAYYSYFFATKYSYPNPSTSLGSEETYGTTNVVFQVRSCDDNACSGESFVGPDGTPLSYYTDENGEDISNVARNQYFQYKAFLTSSSDSLTPQLSAVNVTAASYFQDGPTIQPTASLIPSEVNEWKTFIETATKPSGTEIYYQLSDDDGTTWYWWDGAAWSVAAGATDYNIADDINAHIPTFPTTNGQIIFKAFLKSDGPNTPRLNNLRIDYQGTENTVNCVKDWPFTTSGNYTYNTSLINVSGGSAKLLEVGVNFQDDEQDDFNSGTYTQTEYSTDHIQLSAGQTSGTYRSSIKDAGENVTWQSLAWTPNIPLYKELPDNKQEETAYSSKNVNMADNKLLLHLNESSGQIMDSSGEANNGTDNGGITYGQDGKFNTAIQFDGTDDYIQLDNDMDDVFGTSNDSWTVLAWINPDILNSAQSNHGTQNVIFAKASDPHNDNLEIGVNTSNNLHVYIDGDVNDASANFGGGEITTGSWHFIAVRYSSGTTDVFIDGTKYTDSTT